MPFAARKIAMLSFALVLSQPAPVTAQVGATRATIDSLFDELAQIGEGDPIPDRARCDSYQGSLARLCRELFALKRVERSPEAGPAFDNEMELRRVVDDEPEWATGWFALAMARLQLPRAGVLAREGPLQPLGVTAVAGAGHALVRALELEPSFLLAAEALALAPFPREGPSQMIGRRDMLRVLRDELPLSPEARLGVGLVEREAGDPDTAIVMLREALAAGADGGAVHLELARVLHRVGRSDEGRDVLFAGASLATSGASQQRYRDELRWVASPEEIASWDATNISDRSRWLEAFWVKRDVRDGLEPGERLIEHYIRLEEAMAEFRIVIPQKGRHLVHSVAMAGDAMALEGGDVLGRGGVDSRSGVTAGTPTIEQNEASRRPASDFAATIGPDSPFREFGIEQDLIDDRGVIWIRHGEPTERAATSGGTAMEGWRWTRAPEADLVLFFTEADFDGASGASVLVPSPAGASGQVINQLCGRASGMCDELLPFARSEGPLNRGGAANLGRQGQMNVPMPAASNEVILRSREVGRAQIVRGVTTDDDRREFEDPLEPLVQIYGLDHHASDPRLVVAFALPGERLHGTMPPAAGGRTVYPVRISLMATVEGSPRRFDLDTVRQFAVREPLGEGEFLTATVEMPVRAGTYAATVVIEQGGGIGGMARISAVSTPNPGRLSLSSVVLGKAGGGAAWHSGTQSVPLHPLNAFTSGGNAELYYQVAGMVVGEEYQTRFEFFEAGKESEAASLEVAFSGKASTPTAEVRRTVGLDNLGSGRYLVRVTVSGAGLTATETAYLAVVDE